MRVQATAHTRAHTHTYMKRGGVKGDCIEFEHYPESAYSRAESAGRPSMAAIMRLAQRFHDGLRAHEVVRGVAHDLTPCCAF